jgi:hypothetical protein
LSGVTGAMADTKSQLPRLSPKPHGPIFYLINQRLSGAYTAPTFRPAETELPTLSRQTCRTTMAPKLQGTLSLFTAPAALRIPRSIAECSTPHQGSGSSRQYPYFTSGDLESDKAVIFLGGLTNGMGAVPYVHKLSQELGTAGWRLSVFLWFEPGLGVRADE